MTILIVEDDAAINNLLAEILRGAGYEFIQTFSGTEAKMVLDKEKISFVILDLMLPGLTGEELVPIVREKGKIPILILSAKDASADKVSLLRLGADDYLTKPFDDEELLARIEALMRRMDYALQGINDKELVLHYKDITLDCEGRTVKKKGETLT